MTLNHHEHAGAWRFGGEEPSRILLVGEDNPQSSDPRHALYCYPSGCAGERLQRKILDVGMAEYLGYWRTNLCSPRWSARTARLRALALSGADHPWKLIVGLGVKVAEAFSVVTGGRAMSPFRAQYLGNGEGDDDPMRSATLLILPHPSGRNRVWNTEDVVLRARAAFRAQEPA